jgi:hypothetical protein
MLNERFRADTCPSRQHSHTLLLRTTKAGIGHFRSFPGKIRTVKMPQNFPFMKRIGGDPKAAAAVVVKMG